MTKLRIKTGDKVVVLAGKDKGKTGNVLSASPKDNRVTVKGVNVVAKHKKPRSAQDKGGIIKKEAAIDVSNVQVICPACNKATRVAIGTDGKGQKARICKKCGASLDVNKYVKKAKTTKTAKAEEVAKDKVAKTEKTTAANEQKTASEQPKKAEKTTKTTQTTKTTVKRAVKDTTTTTKSVAKTSVRKTSPTKKIAGK